MTKINNLLKEEKKIYNFNEISKAQNKMQLDICDLQEYQRCTSVMINEIKYTQEKILNVQSVISNTSKKVMNINILVAIVCFISISLHVVKYF